MSGLLVYLTWLDRIPGPALTASTMSVLRRRVLRFARDHDSVPADLGELPQLAGFTTRLDDGWGRPIRLELRGEEAVLVSLGRDGRAGGRGDDHDLIGVFALRGADGRWADDAAGWLVDPLELDPQDAATEER